MISVLSLKRILDIKLKGLHLHNDELYFFKDLYVISIVDFDRPKLFPDSNEILNLSFDDTGYNEYGRLFNYTHAKLICDFLEKTDKSKHLIVHCTMGVSRSGAVAEFAVDHFYPNIEYSTFIEKNNFIIPNVYIKNQLIGYYLKNDYYQH